MKFFIGCSPSQAKSIINPNHSASGTMISLNKLRDRYSDFEVSDWVMDSGAFTEIARHGTYRFDVREYYDRIVRWSRCGNLLAAVAQDFMVESTALKRTGLTVEDHQRLTIERYDRLISLSPPVPIIPVLQGYLCSDYARHLRDYGNRLPLGQWVGVGSICRRKSTVEIYDLLQTIKLIRPDLKLHGFGIGRKALASSKIRSLLYSADSMAWSFPNRFDPSPKPEIELAHLYQEKVCRTAVGDFVQKRVPRSAGAGNGQGRKPKWKAGKTKAIRVPEQFAERLLAIARQWDDNLET